MRSLTRLRRGLDLDARAGHQPELAVGHHPVAGGQSLLDDRVGADVSARNDLTNLDRQVGPDQVYVRSRLTRLDGLRRYEDRVPFGRQGHDDVDELTGPETPSLIREAGLEPDGPGRRVDHVVDERERSLRPGQRLPGGAHLHLQAP